MKKATRKTKKTTGTPIAVVSVAGGVCMLERMEEKKGGYLFLSWSTDGLRFSSDKTKIKIENLKGKEEDIKECDNFSLSRTHSGFVMTFVKEGKKKGDFVTVIARSEDLYNWKVKSEIKIDEPSNTTISYSKERDSFELYRDGLFIKNQASKTLTVWKGKPNLLFTSRNTYFDSDKLSLIGSLITKEGIMLMYDASIEHKAKTLLQVGIVICDINDPKRVIWRSAVPVWQGVASSKSKKLSIKPLGFASLGENFHIYWTTKDNGLIIVTLPAIFKETEESKRYPKILARHQHNPIIEPRNHHEWEVEGTFNPTVVEDDEGTIHLLYRAVGKDGLSRVGYACSTDGTTFTKRSSFPVFEPGMGFGMPDPQQVRGPEAYHPAMYTSGGGYGGAEDPRAVRIDDKIYMLYVAFEGWNSIRIALTSISVDDFKNGKWNWKKPVHISPPGKVNKNWLLFPEKVNGKYAIIHSIAPKISIEYIDDINNIEEHIDSPRKGGPQPGRKNKWDSILRGAGPSPVKTELGWLLLYHALEKTDSSKYKLGAMILDLNDPTKILHRSMHPILSPDMHYENNGKPGVIYASGAILRGDELYVYYGGADKVVCMAKTPIKDFLDYLVTGKADSYELEKAS